jgi:type II secretory ATPase GspE/PulE/Tfp pilus assembly ATPase PilB-like protein
MRLRGANGRAAPEAPAGEDGPSAAAGGAAPHETAPALVERLLERARALGASDLHLDPDERGMAVRARRDGILEPLERVPASLAREVVGRLKALADLLAYRTDLPQEGRIPAARSPIGVEARVSTFPAQDGERVAIRLDAPGAAALGLDDLGLEGAARLGLSRALAARDGAVLLTGPSGSGKTTTLYACLRRLAAEAPPRSIVTIEDPIERRVAGVVQTQANPAAGLTFPRALRSLLRQDPEVILLGEVRDRESAAVALEAALTGHLVLSTVHAGRAPLVCARLLDMGVEPFVLATAVRGVLGQRLLRRKAGGRRLVAEWLAPGKALRAAIHARADGDGLARAAAADGFRSLGEEAARLVEAGETTREEVLRVLGAGAMDDTNAAEGTT